MTPSKPREWLALAALFAGATAIATAPLFVKVSETGPVATAFWRVFLALPPLWIWALISQGSRHREHLRNHRGMLIAAAVFFTGDLAVWHWSILLTSVANTTLLAIGASDKGAIAVAKGGGTRQVIATGNANLGTPNFTECMEKALALIALIQSQGDIARLTAGPPGIPADRLNALIETYRRALNDKNLGYVVDSIAKVL